MSNGNTVPVFDPQGKLRDIPQSQLVKAVQNRGMPAVQFRQPGSDKIRLVPANRTREAVEQGGTIVPITEQTVKHPGFWRTLYEDIQSIPQALMGPDPLADPGVPMAEKNRLVAQQQAQAAATNRARTQQHGRGYSMAATLGEMLGVPVGGMEQSAAQGNVRGVLGHAAFLPATMAATEGLTRGGMATGDLSGKLSDALAKPAQAFKDRLPTIEEFHQTINNQRAMREAIRQQRMGPQERIRLQREQMAQQVHEAQQARSQAQVEKLQAQAERLRAQTQKLRQPPKPPTQAAKPATTAKPTEPQAAPAAKPATKPAPALKPAAKPTPKPMPKPTAPVSPAKAAARTQFEQLLGSQTPAPEPQMTLSEATAALKRMLNEARARKAAGGQ